MTTEGARIREWVRLWLAGASIREIQQALGGARGTICGQVALYLGEEAYQRSKADRYNAGRRRATEASALARARAKGETPRLYHRPRRDGRCSRCLILLSECKLSGIQVKPPRNGLCGLCQDEIHYTQEWRRGDGALYVEQVQDGRGFEHGQR